MPQEKHYKNLDTELATGKLFVKIGDNFNIYVLITDGNRALPRAIQFEVWRSDGLGPYTEPDVTDWHEGIASDEFMELLQNGKSVEEAAGDEHHRMFLRSIFRYFLKHT